MKIDELVNILKDYSKLHRLYDLENPEFYINSIKYDEDQDKLYVDFEEEKTKGRF